MCYPILVAASIEEKVEDYFKAQLNGLGVKYYTKTDSINPAIEKALKAAESKSGGAGVNYPDIKVLLQGAGGRDIPVMIEAKGGKGRLCKLDKLGGIELVRSDGSRAAIANYAVNGAVHYVNAILDEGTYKEGIAVGVNGYETEGGTLYELKAFYISTELAREPKELPYADLSFLASPDKLFPVLDNIDLTEEERERLIAQKRDQFDKVISDIHQKIYEDEQLKTRLGTNDKLMFFSGLIFAGLGDKELPAFTCDDLKGSETSSRNDGALIIERIREILEVRGSATDKAEMILADLAKVFRNKELYTPRNGESLIKKYFREVEGNVIPILTLRLNADFTGIILSKMKDWLDLDNDKKNDVVLTPRYVTTFMARLCRTDMDSIVWDTAMGSGGFLISAMEIMIEDAKRRLPPHEQEEKIRRIKEEQLLGIEILSNIYILAVINMILTGDGSSTMRHGDSFDYIRQSDSFPYNVFLLNPPYSAGGKGLSFVDAALKRMTKGYGAVLIQENAGSGNGQPYAANILKHSSLVASIRMADIFKGRSGVQTAIYLFKVNEPHKQKSLVTFIDFSQDGYQRQNRRKSSEAVNLQDVDHAQERYAEVEAIVLNEKKETNYYNEENGTVIKDTITLEGNDWTFAQHKKVDITPVEENFKQTVKDYLSWKVSQIMQGSGEGLGKHLSPRLQALKEDFEKSGGSFEKFRIGDLFDIHPTKSYGLTNSKLFASRGNTPVVVNSSINNGVGGYADLPPTEKANTITFSDTTSADSIFLQDEDFIGYSHVQGLYPREENKWTSLSLLYFVAVFRHIARQYQFDYAYKFNRKIAMNMTVLLPTRGKELAFSYMEQYIREVEAERVREVEAERAREVEAYLAASGLDDYD